MGKVAFPIHNVRKDILNNWHFAELNEEILVPSQPDEHGFYTISLIEIPDSSSLRPVLIPGLSEYRGNPYNDKTKKITIATTQFYVNYSTGEILFHSAQAGALHTVSYWGKGSLVEAEDVNDLDERVVAASSAVSSMQEAVDQAQEAVAGVVADMNDVKAQTAAVVTSVSEINTDLQSVHTDLNLKANTADVDSAISDTNARVDSYFVEGGEVDARIDSKLSGYLSNDDYASDQEQKAAAYDEKYATASGLSEVSAAVETAAGNISTLQTELGTTNQNVDGVSTRVTTLENAGFITSEALEPLATKEEIADMAVKSDLEGLASEQFVSEAIEPLATKAELSAYATVESLEPLASKEYVSEAIEPLATKAELEPLASKEYVDEQIPDVSEFVTAEDVSTAISGAGHVSPSQLSGLVAVDGNNARSAQHKIVTKSNNKDLTAMIWNESSGGGAMFTNEDAGTKSFIGVNNGVDVTPNFWVQGYAINTTSKLGSRIELDTTGFYYTKNQTNYSYTADDEVVVKKDITGYATQEYVGEQIAEIDIPDVSSFVTAEDVSAAVSGAGHASQEELATVDTKVDSTHDAFLERIVNLEMKVEDLTRTNIDNVPSTAQINYTDTTKDVVISADAQVTQPSTITAGSIEVNSLNVDSTRVSLTSDGKVKIGGFESTGTYPKSQGNAQVIITTDDYVEIRNSTFGIDGYNAIEIGLNNAVPKSVIIDNCQFGGNLSNNAILVFGHQDDAIIKVSNCTFTKVSNALRISNRTNTKGTFIFENCAFNEWDSDLAYAGAVICEDYSSKSVAAETENNLFAPEKIKIKFINCTGPDGNVMVGGPDPSVYCGSNDENQIMYVYNDCGYGLAYDPARYPEVTFG